LNSFELFLEEQGGKLAGREVKLVTEDDAGNPPPASPKLREWQRAKGFKSSSVLSRRLWLRYPRLHRQQEASGPSFPIVSGEDITQRKRSPYIVRTGWSSAQPSHPFGKWVYDTSNTDGSP